MGASAPRWPYARWPPSLENHPWAMKMMAPAIHPLLTAKDKI